MASVVDARLLVESWRPTRDDLAWLRLPPTLTVEDRDWVRRMLAAAGITEPTSVPLSGASLNSGWWDRRTEARAAS